MRISFDPKSLVLCAAIAAAACLPAAARAADPAPAHAGHAAEHGAPADKAGTVSAAEKPAGSCAGECSEGAGCGCMKGAEGKAQAQMSEEAKSKRSCGCKHGQAQ